MPNNRLLLEELEPRLLLSAGWFDADTGSPISGSSNGDDIFIGSTGADLSIVAGNGDDIVHGGLGDDYLEGNNHADVIIGGGGSDTMFGGNHNDLFLFTGAQDGDVNTVDGGKHNDTIDLSEFGPVSVNVINGSTISVDLGGGQSFTINHSNIENIVTAETTGVNHAPEADAGADQTVATNTLVTLDGSASSDLDGDSLTYQWTQIGGPWVSLSDRSSSSPTFTSPSDPDTLTFVLTVSDGTVQNIDFVEITVNGPNNAPTAIDLSNNAVNENIDTTGGISIGTLTTTDIDAGDTFSYTVVGGADQVHFSIGGVDTDELILDDGLLDYETQPSYDVIVQTRDAGGLTHQESFVININPVNEATPQGIADAFSVNEGASFDSAADLLSNGENSVLGNDLGLADTPIILSLVTDVSHGALVLNADGTFSYTHDGSEQFSDQFTYRITDADDEFSQATVAITVNPVNDNHPLVQSETLTVASGNTATLLDSGQASVLANDTDLDLPHDALTVSLDIGPTHASAFTLNPDGTFSYTHDGSGNLSDSFNYTVSDAIGRGATVTVNINIIPAGGTTPQGIADAFSLNEGASFDSTVDLLSNGESNLLGNDLGLADTPITASLVADVSHGALTLNPDGTFSYTHDGSEQFNDQFTYRITDADNEFSQATVAITVNPVNDNAPLAQNDTLILDEGDTITRLASGQTSVMANDTDADLPHDNLTVSLVTDVSHGTLTLNPDGTFSYTHDGSEQFNDQFTYRITDADNEFSQATVAITVNPANDNAPLAQNDTLILDEGDTITRLASGQTSVMANDTDADLPHDNLTVSLVTDVSHGALTLNPNGTFSYTHDGSENFSDSFTYRAADNNGQFSETTVAITVNPVNDNAPLAQNDTLILDEGDTITRLASGQTSVMANDTDADLPHDNLTVSLVTDVSHGALTLNPNGTFSYTHDGSENFSDSFTYTVTDNNGQTDIATVIIHINADTTPVDDPEDEPDEDPVDEPDDEPVDEPVDEPDDDPKDDPDEPDDEPVDEPDDDPKDDPDVNLPKVDIDIDTTTPETPVYSDGGDTPAGHLTSPDDEFVSDTLSDDDDSSITTILHEDITQPHRRSITLDPRSVDPETPSQVETDSVDNPTDLSDSDTDQVDLSTLDPPTNTVSVSVPQTITKPTTTHVKLADTTRNVKTNRTLADSAYAKRLVRQPEFIRGLNTIREDSAAQIFLDKTLYQISFILVH